MPEAGQRKLSPWEIAARHRSALNPLREGTPSRRLLAAKLSFPPQAKELRRLCDDLVALLGPADDPEVAREV